MEIWVLLMRKDCVIFISKSGELSEFPPIYHFVKEKNVLVLAITFVRKKFDR